MRVWLEQNWGNAVILTVIAAIVAAVVIFRIRARRRGKGGCGCGCTQCSMQGICHTSENKKK